MEPTRSVTQVMTLGQQDTEVFSVRWNPEDSHIAAAMGDGTVRLFSASDGSFIRSLNCRLTAEAMPVTGIRWRPANSMTKTKNVLVSITCDGVIMHWHATSGKELHRIILPNNQCLAIDYSLDGSHFAVGCKDMCVKVYDESTKSMVCELSQGLGERLGHSNRIFSVKWLDESTLASAGWDNNLLVWDLRTRNVVKGFYGPHVCGDTLDVRGGVLVTASYNSTDQVELWDLASEQRVRGITLKHTDHVCLAYAAQFSKFDGGQTLAVGGSGGDECYFFHSNTMEPFAVLTNIPRAVFSLDHAHSDGRVAIGCGDGTIRVVQIIKA